MTDGFSRRSWLRGVFSGLVGLAGLRRRATAVPTAPRPEGTAPPSSTTVRSYAYDLGPISSVSVSTYSYDAKGRLTTVVDPLCRVTTYPYYDDPQNRPT